MDPLHQNVKKQNKKKQQRCLMPLFCFISNQNILMLLAELQFNLIFGQGMIFSYLFIYITYTYAYVNKYIYWLYNCGAIGLVFDPLTLIFWVRCIIGVFMTPSGQTFYCSSSTVSVDAYTAPPDHFSRETGAHPSWEADCQLYTFLKIKKSLFQGI